MFDKNQSFEIHILFYNAYYHVSQHFLQNQFSFYEQNNFLIGSSPQLSYPPLYYKKLNALFQRYFNMPPKRNMFQTTLAAKAKEQQQALNRLKHSAELRNSEANLKLR